MAKKQVASFREIAGNWHGGQWSALYAYSSTGAILLPLDTEIRDCMQLAKTRQELRELQDFYNYVAPYSMAPIIGADREVGDG